MFTGLVEEIGMIESIKKGVASSQLIIHADNIMNDVKKGDSIAVNGVCLTVTTHSSKQFQVDVMHETLTRSSLGNLQVGSKVNLERAMRADGRFGGHIVSGHIDGTGVITMIQKDDIAIWYTVEANEKILKYVIEKGSVAIDGISLTVAKVGREDFCVSVIPHTEKMTILKHKKVGDIVNLENDCIGKYVERLVLFQQENKKQDNKKQESKLTKDFLTQYGY